MSAVEDKNKFFTFLATKITDMVIMAVWGRIYLSQHVLESSQF